MRQAVVWRMCAASLWSLKIAAWMILTSCAPAARSNSPPLQGDTTPPASPPAYEWRLPLGFPVPRVPTDNPMTPAKVDLGRHLFYDRALSGNGTYS
ncbi:MAG: hypothetical protein L0170_05565, partial [Acidobacteria bacterium]|nr:hypothetical protein [Acidobacteriota bacterium]